MQIVQFKENQKEIWNKFITENDSGSFLQAWEWGEFQKNVGRKILRVGVINNDFRENNKETTSIKYRVSSDNLLAAALVIKYDLPFKQSYLYCPRGPVISQKFIKSKVQRSDIVDFLIEKIKKIGREEKTMFLKIDPPIEMNQKQGVPPPLGKARWDISKNFKKSSNEIQPRNTLILDLTKSEEELLKKMKPKTRYNIRLAERKGVKIINTEYRIPNTECFNNFWKLVEETSRRDKFASHNKNYYWKMLESLSKKHSSGNPPDPLFQRRNFQEKNNLCYLQAKLYLAEYKNKTIAANIVLSFGDFCVYLHGASSSEHRNVMAPYLLQWRQILDAKKTGCKSYDFWGIEESQKSVKSKVHKVKNSWSGITRFKKGFDREEKNYIGAYDLIFNWKKYYAYKVFRKIRNLF